MSEQLAVAVNRLVEVTESMQQRLEAVERRLELVVPEKPIEVFTFEQVANILQISLSLVKKRVQSGEWGYCLDGTVKRIPKSELVRITVAMHTRSSAVPSSLLPKKSLPRPRRSKGYDAKAEAEKLRARLSRKTRR